MAIRARPLHDRIVVRPETPVNTTPGGIYLPPIAREKNKLGEVVASGPGFIDKKGQLHPNTLKPGDKVMFGSYAGVELILDGDSYQIMREGDVAGVIVEE